MSNDSDDTARKRRILVLCFDGTASEYSSANTNVVKFFSLLKKDDFEDQLCYYQAGIGTFFAPGVVSPVFQWWAKILDEAVAWYLDAHVMDGYKFLMQNYRAGDKICLFGFSRGAYTARALAGMLYKVGLLPRGNSEQIPFAYKLYTRTDDTGITLSAGFKRTYSQSVSVEFLGVWDTVASVGVVATKTLPFTADNTSIKTFRQALSLDEACLHRVRFKPNLFHRDPPPSAPAGSVQGEQIAESKQSEPNTRRRRLARTISDYFRKGHKGHVQIKSPKMDSPTVDAPKVERDIRFESTAQPDTKRATTDVLEVWFAGCHSDIGGSAVPNSTTQSLANITLRWMVKQVMQSQCGIQFSQAALMQLAIPMETIPIPVPPPSSDTSPSSPDTGAGPDAGPDSEANPWEALDKLDSTQPLHDSLVQTRAWWLLEILPMKTTWQDADCVWHSTYGWNLGRGREIYDRQPNFHVTVKERLADEKLKYKPKARWQDGTQVYIE